MEHLQFTKVELPSHERRKRGGFVPRGEKKNNVQHGGELLNQIKIDIDQNAKDIHDFHFDPHLVMKVNLEKDATLTEDNISKLESMGLRVIDTEAKELMVLFADDCELKEFDRAISNYKQGVIARTKIENEDLFSAIKSVSRWESEDRKGQDIDNLSDVDYIDCYLWIFDTLNETQQKANEFIRSTEGKCMKYCDKYISQAVAVVRLKIEKEQLTYFLKHPLVYKVDRIPNYHIKRTERTTISSTKLTDISYSNELLTEKSASICVIDSGILSGHPLLKEAIGDSKTFFATEGYQANENDIDGHGTMVAGICEYGKIDLNSSFQPQIYLYNAKIHDGEYIGDFNLCKQELEEEGITLDMDQEEVLDKYFRGLLVESDLFCAIGLKKRLNEFKSIVRKYTHLHEKLIPNQMREIVEYFHLNYGCRIFNLSQGDLNYPYDDGKPRAWTCVLDELQREYDILFVVSTGNYDYAFEHDESQIIKEYPSYFYLDNKARIIDPAASSIALTVGAMANSNVPLTSSDDKIQYLSISSSKQISSRTRLGPGIQKAVKPEFLAYGGDVLFNTLTSRISTKNSGTSILSFSNKLVDGLFCYDIGTSFAAPYISHIAAKILNRYPEASNNLIRAIIVSSADISKEIIEQLEQLNATDNFIKNISSNYKRNEKGTIKCDKKRMLHYLAGYGYPNQKLAIDSFEQRVVLLADMINENAIEVDKSHIFEIPIPKEFQKAKGKKKIIISLAFNPDVRKTRMDYLGKEMSFDLIRGKSLDEVYQVCASQAGRDEADKLKMFDSKFICKLENCGKILREHGTLQKGVFEFSKSDYGENYYLVVSCKKNWSKEKQEYAVVVTYQVEDNTVELYDILKTRVRAPRTRRRA